MIQIPEGARAVGVQLPVQSQSELFVADWERTAGPDEMAAVARAADQAGFSYVGVCDHVVIPESLAGTMGTHWVDPIATLAWLAAATERIGLLTHVYVLPYRHPLLAAKQFATLDHLSKGRAICGIGAGHVEAEFDRLGADFAGRGSYLDENIPILIAALEQEYVDGFGATPRPVQRPRPPVWVAGSSPAAIRRAAWLGDGWLPQGPTDADKVRLLTETRVAAGRADDPMVIGHLTPPVHLGRPGWDVGPFAITGSAEEVAERLLAGTVDGVNQLQVRLLARSCEELCDQLAAFGSEVLPSLGKNGARAVRQVSGSSPRSA